MVAFNPTENKNLSLQLRKNFKYNEQQKEKSLKEAKELLGFDVSFVVEGDLTKMDALASGYSNRLGELLYKYYLPCYVRV
jgi:hypothetical protein